MASVIWKFGLTTEREQSVPMPTGARILSVGQQQGGLMLWALCDPNVEFSDRHVYVVATGSFADMAKVGAADFKGTVQMPGGLVWHIFAEPSP